MDDTLFKYGRCVGKIYKPHILTQIQNMYSCRESIKWSEISQVNLNTYAELAEERDLQWKRNQSK